MPNTCAPSTVHVAPASVDLRNPLTAHREGAEVEITCAGVDGVMIAGINDNGVNSCGRNERVISDYCPRRHVAAAIRRFPDAAANRAGIGDDAAIHGRGWIDSNGVDSTFGGCVIKTTRAAGHVLWLWTECRKVFAPRGDGWPGLRFW